ncbi:phosphatase PAP2 family protein [Vibrio sp. SCSIO 43137]|uniref:phosphatase PAP2 family protein n=1 Tax=Vibrio sp. SCSIO 43137 TaxID=3021011 RepID=UPI00230792B6|nr:phosphatase PAP2 family protein [Vibrio sp. SCSIO 43137]WCE28815.1 phosphatase PAP2 family protein [Vibrio sp. SCSIO 43137]
MHSKASILPSAFTVLKKFFIELKSDRYIYGLVVVSSLIINLIPAIFDLTIKFKFSMNMYLGIIITGCFAAFLAWSTYYYIYLLVHKASDPIQKYLSKIRTLIFPLGRSLKFILNLVVINVALSSYTYLKKIIPQLVPYQYDELFYDIDKLLHFGVSPWELTHAMFSGPYGTLFINFLYNLWFFFMWGGLLYALFISNARLRNQIVLSFLLCWFVIGNFSATLLSSVGPAFMHLLDNSYQQYLPLMAILEQQRELIMSSTPFDIWALDTQNILWDSYVNNFDLLGSGISAMPSMHVSIAVLMAIAGFSINKKVGYFLTAYAVFVQIGSVHLAWHYAIDGYLSFILTLLIWWLVKRFVNSRFFAFENSK